MRWTAWAACLLALLGAGCAAEAPVEPAPVSAREPPVPWAMATPALVNPAGEGFEPSLRVAGDGALYLAAARGFFVGADGSAASPVWASRDGGATWQPLASPGGLRERFKAIEGDLAVDSAGAVYFIDTYAADNVLTVWGPDGSWRSTRPLHGTLALDDRPWLAAHGDGVLYAMGNSIATAPSPDAPLDLGRSSRIALYRSEDGGLTWTLGTTFPGAWYCHAAASPADGQSLAVACSTPSGQGGTDAPPGVGARLHWSADRGRTWETRDIAPRGDVGLRGFPSVSYDAMGRWCAG